MSNEYSGTSSGPFNIEGASSIVTLPPASEKKYTGEEAYGVFESQVRFLQGDILTIVDAAFADKEQRKAVKDLVRAKFNDRFKWVHEIMTGGRLVLAEGEKMPPL